LLTTLDNRTTLPKQLIAVTLTTTFVPRMFIQIK
jgi:hypothetical protein